MEYKNIFSFDVEWNYKTIGLFLFLLALPNLLGMINIATPFGFKLHFFQAAIFLAALIYGPVGGLASGLVGSAYTAAMMGNPYIVVGNVLLGFFVGLFARYGMKTVFAVWLAFIIQLPWLVLTDYYLVHLPIAFIISLVVALAVSNTVWAIVAHYAAKPVKHALG
jgi:uncharacterized membrane protein